MPFSFNQYFGKVNVPPVNYRVLVAILLVLAALPLLFITSCSKKTLQQNHAASANEQGGIIQTPQAALSQRPLSNTSSVPGSESYYVMNVVEYYEKNHYFANDRIQLNHKVTSFIKHPPLKSNPGLYRRYKKAKADYYKVRKYRKRLEKMERNHVGRNHLISSIKPKRERYFKLEAELFYQLEKMVFFAEQSYMEWQIFKSHDAIQLSQFEKNSITKSVQTADLFEDFSYAVTNYTNASR